MTVNLNIFNVIKEMGDEEDVCEVGSRRVLEMWDLGEYQKCGIWASTRNVGSGRVPEMWDLGEYQKGRIQESTGNVGSGRVP